MIVTAWLVVGVALTAILAQLRYIRRNPASNKRPLRIYAISATAYICVIYILIGLGHIPISETGALLARAGFIILLCLFAAESLVDG